MEIFARSPTQILSGLFIGVVLLAGVYVSFFVELTVNEGEDGNHVIVDYSLKYGPPDARRLAENFCAERGQYLSVFNTKKKRRRSQNGISTEYHFTCID